MKKAQVRTDCTVTGNEILVAVASAPLTMSELKAKLIAQKGCAALKGNRPSFDLSFAMLTDAMLSEGALSMNSQALLVDTTSRSKVSA